MVGISRMWTGGTVRGFRGLGSGGGGRLTGIEAGDAVAKGGGRCEYLFGAEVKETPGRSCPVRRGGEGGSGTWNIVGARRRKNEHYSGVGGSVDLGGEQTPPFEVGMGIRLNGFEKFISTVGGGGRVGRSLFSCGGGSRPAAEREMFWSTRTNEPFPGKE